MGPTLQAAFEVVGSPVDPLRQPPLTPSFLPRPQAPCAREPIGSDSYPARTVSALEFIAAVAWPVTVLAIALIFRRPITNMLAGQIGRMKAGPFEVEWQRTLSEVETELDQEPIAQAAPARPDGGLSAELDPVARRAPTAAVLEAHARVEAVLRAVLQSRGVTESSDQLGAVGLARLARSHGVVTDETAQAIEGLSVLRNLAAHGRARDVSAERARDYLALADGVLFAVESNARQAACQ